MRLVAAPAAANSEQLTSRLAALIVHTELSRESLSAVHDGLIESSPPVAAHPAMSTGDAPGMIPVKASADVNPERRKIAQVVGLLMGTAEFQRR